MSMGMFGGCKASLFLLRWSLGKGCYGMPIRALDLGRSCGQCWSSTLAKGVHLQDLGSSPTSTVSSLGGYGLVTLTSLDMGVHICKTGAIVKTFAMW